MNVFRHTTLALALISLISLRSPAQSGSRGNNLEEVVSDEDRIEFNQIRISFEYGLSTRLAKIAPGLNLDEAGFAEKLRDGMDYRFSMGYFLNPNVGIGLCYDRWLTNYSAIGKFTVEGVEATYDRTSHEEMNYIGPSIIGRLLGKSASLMGAVGLGYYNYYSETSMKNQGFSGNSWLKGSTLGMNISVSLDLKLYKNIYMGFSGYYLAGAIQKFDTKDVNGVEKKLELESGSAEGIARVGGAIGLRMYLLPKVIQNKSED